MRQLNRSTLTLVGVGVIGFAIGYFAGREHLKYEIKSTLTSLVGGIFPNLLNARQSGNEASAISSLRTITTASEQYKNGRGCYAGSLANLESAKYIDTLLGKGNKSGYKFDYSTSTGNEWTCTASPVVEGTTGNRFFFVDESGVIRVSTKGIANLSSELLDSEVSSASPPKTKTKIMRTVPNFSQGFNPDNVIVSIGEHLKG